MSLVLAGLVTAGCGDGQIIVDTFPSPSASSGAPTPSPSGQVQLLISYKREGGIAGFSDQLLVRSDGSFTLTGRLRSASAGILPEAQLAELRQVLQSADFAGMPTHSPLRVADGFTHVIQYQGREVTAGDGNIPSTLEPVITALDRILREHP